jgi:hypothetical protein
VYNKESGQESYWIYRGRTIYQVALRQCQVEWEGLKGGRDEGGWRRRLGSHGGGRHGEGFFVKLRVRRRAWARVEKFISGLV